MAAGTSCVWGPSRTEALGFGEHIPGLLGAVSLLGLRQLLAAGELVPTLSINSRDLNCNVTPPRGNKY